MTFGNTVRGFVAVTAMGLGLAFSATLARADDTITDSHLKAARAAISAIKATDVFDVILPGLAQALKSDLIQRSPNLEDAIDKIVDQETFKLVSRRADLEKEAATDYAKVFPEDELNQIAAFYNTKAGKDLIDHGPRVTQALTEAGEIWQRGIARDLQKNVGDALKAAGVDKTDTPADDTTTGQGSGNQ